MTILPFFRDFILRIHFSSLHDKEKPENPAPASKEGHHRDGYEIGKHARIRTILTENSRRL
jgi:hypothetical protein